MGKPVEFNSEHMMNLPDSRSNTIRSYGYNGSQTPDRGSEINFYSQTPHTEEHATTFFYIKVLTDLEDRLDYKLQEIQLRLNEAPAH